MVYTESHFVFVVLGFEGWVPNWFLHKDPVIFDNVGDLRALAFFSQAFIR